MRYKVMTVWSCQSEKAIIEKIKLVLLCLTYILLGITVVTQFLKDPVFGIFLLAITGFFILLLPLVGGELFKMIKQNKLIVLVLFEFDEFVKLGTIPRGTFIVFSNTKGVVLGFTEYISESKFFCEGAKFFYEFEEYYESKKPVYKEEVTEDPKEFLNHVSQIVNNIFF